MSDVDAELDLNGIAIIGMSGRFPGARNIGEFWQNLRGGVESLTFFTDEDLESEGLDPSIRNHPNYVNAGMPLEGIEYFDAAFFGYSPRDAEIMDPQQRLFLEEAWASLEDAGYDPETYKGLIGLYAGSGMSHYLFNLYANREIMESVGGFQLILGNDKDHLTTRVAYKLNLKGPAVTVQTTCSTSLVAVCQACQSLLTYQCDMALAGGSSIILPQRSGYFYQPGGIASPDGHCRAFDARAQGTIGGSGVGVVVLKRLEEAWADGDHIYAVIRGFGVNNDGSDKVGYTAPSVEGQAEVITMSLAMSGVSADSVTYVEAHGTGTPMGDPIEVAALTSAFRSSTKDTKFCALGSVKSNIGHLDPAAGIAGLIKTVLALDRKEIPPTLHFQHPNPNIDFANSPFYVADKLSDWKNGSAPRRAGVSSFGIGGTNAHVTLEEAPPVHSAEPSRTWQLLTLSAQTSPGLVEATVDLADHLRRNPDVNLADAAYTLQVGRRAFQHRRVVVCTDANQALRMLESQDDRYVFSGLQSGAPPPVVFMFSGQGAQHVHMGRDLYRTEPIFRSELDHCAELLQPHLDLDLRDLLYPSSDDEAAADTLTHTAFAQPGLFAVEYALSQLWMSWGVRPQAMVGHSIGEYVAACLAGVLSLEDALSLVATRGKLMQQMPSGTMLAVLLPERELKSLPQDLSLAAVNGSSLCVVSGPEEAVVRYEGGLKKRNIGCRRLHTSHAFHSPMMEPMLEPFRAELDRVTLLPPQIPFLSNTSGTWITPGQATDPEYWVWHLRHTVRFSDNLRELSRTEGNVLLEIGPGQTLSTLARQFQEDGLSEQVVLASLPHPREEPSATPTWLSSLGRLWLAGVEVDWSGIHAGERRLRIPMPTYPFQRQRYWIEPPREKPSARDRPAAGDRPAAAQRIEKNVEEWFYKPTWQRTGTPAPARLISPSSKLQWLIFGHLKGLAPELASRLVREGQRVLMVIPGDRFARHDDYRYEMDPRHYEDHAVLFEELRRIHRLPDRILHLWTVSPVESVASSLADSERLLDVGFYSLLFLAKSLGEHMAEARQQLTVISNSTQMVTGNERLYPENAAARGACTVIAQEFPHIVCRCLDVEVVPGGVDVDMGLLDDLMAELSAESTEPVVAFRENSRWISRYEPVPLRAPLQDRRLRQRGVYLITGGLGGIGLKLAEYLARNFRARLILTGRTAFRDDANGHAPPPEPGRHSRPGGEIKKVQELERLGAEVVVVRADVTSSDDMRRVSRLIAERFGALNGIIHAAGVAGGGLISLKTADMAARVLAPKVAGTRILDQIFGEADLDFVMLCSSLASLLGGIGQVDYCAANCFLDAFAHDQMRRADRLTVSINWERWLETGMAFKSSPEGNPTRAGERHRAEGLLSEEGIRAFEHILGSDRPQIAVSTTDLGTRIGRWQGQKLSREPQRQQQAPVSARHARPSLETTYVAPRNDVERRIADVWQELLGIEQVGIDDSFLDLGGHSLLAIQLISRLRHLFNVEISVQALFESPTVARLAAMVSADESQNERDLKRIQELLQQVEELTDEELRTLTTFDTEHPTPPVSKQ